MTTVDKFIADFKSRGWDSRSFERLVDLIDRDGPSLLLLAKRILEEIPSGGTFFDVLQVHTSRGKCLYACLEYANLLTPYLRFLFGSTPNNRAYYKYSPWRGADEGEVDELLLSQNSSSMTLPSRSRVTDAGPALAVRQNPALILLSDGLENCNGDVSAAVQAVKAKGIKLLGIAYGQYNPSSFSGFDSIAAADTDQDFLNALAQYTGQAACQPGFFLLLQLPAN